MLIHKEDIVTQIEIWDLLLWYWFFFFYKHGITFHILIGKLFTSAICKDGTIFHEEHLLDFFFQSCLLYKTTYMHETPLCMRDNLCVGLHRISLYYALAKSSEAKTIEQWNPQPIRRICDTIFLEFLIMKYFQLNRCKKLVKKSYF